MSDKKKPPKKTHSAHSKKAQHVEDECCIHEDVMKQIHEDHIEMRPKVYFILGSALVGVGTAGAVITSILFTHVTLYKLRYDAAFEYLDLGSVGYTPFLQSFPWLPLGVAVVGLIGGARLLKEYELSYKHRYHRLLIAFIALILTLGFFLDRAGAEKHMTKMKPFDTLYDTTNHKPFIHGKVVRVNGPRALVLTPYNDKYVIDVSSSLKPVSLRPGQVIRATGEWDGEVFYTHVVLPR